MSSPSYDDVLGAFVETAVNMISLKNAMLDTDSKANQLREAIVKLTKGMENILKRIEIIEDEITNDKKEEDSGAKFYCVICNKDSRQFVCYCGAFCACKKCGAICDCKESIKP